MKNNALIYELITESQGDLAVRMREVFDRGYEQGLKDNSEEAYQKGLNDAWECARKILNAVVPYDCWNMGSYNHISHAIKCYSASEAIEKIRQYEEQKKAEEEIKVGDRVRTIKDQDEFGHCLFPIGTIGIIKYLDSHPSSLKYCISADDDYWWYSRDMFEVIGDDEILVGDEVKHYADGTKAVVLDFVDDGERVMIFDKNGIAEGWELSKVRKTGRSFTQIAEVLKQLQEGEE